MDKKTESRSGFANNVIRAKRGLALTIALLLSGCTTVDTAQPQNPNSDTQSASAHEQSNAVPAPTLEIRGVGGFAYVEPTQEPLPPGFGIGPSEGAGGTDAQPGIPSAPFVDQTGDA